MPRTAVLIGQPATLGVLERQLDLVPDRPRTLGWVLVPEPMPTPGKVAAAGIDDLEVFLKAHEPDLALITLPSSMGDLVASIRTRLRRIGIPDRFMPTLQDQIAGVGPRAEMDIDLAGLLGRQPRTIDEEAVRSIIESRRVLITGAGGSIGSELARIVADLGPKHLVLMDRAENPLFEIDRQIARRAPDLGRAPILHDVVDPEGTLTWFRRFQPEVIFHAAAHKHVPMMESHPGAACDNNLFGTKSVADAADAVRADRFVMISTDKAVNPASIMGATKRLAELYVQWLNRRSDTAFSMVRFGNVLGSSGSVLEIWKRQIADGGPVTVTDAAMTRYFMTIPEAAALVIESAALIEAHAAEGAVFLLDMDRPIRILEMAQRFIALHGLTPILPGQPCPDGAVGTMRIVLTGARPGEKLHEELAFDAECMESTRHPDINVWLQPEPEERLIKDMLCALSPEVRDPDAALVAEAIRRVVPGMRMPATARART
jgi:FlaA1/EpsC-like NDP-sugar epimerase